MDGDFEHARISTEGLSPREAKAYWADHVSEICHGVECDYSDDHPMAAVAEYASFGSGRIVKFQLVGHRSARRMPHHIAKDSFNCVALTFAIEGATTLSYKTGEIYVTRGNLIICDTSEQFLLDFNGRVEFSAIYFERDWLTSTVDVPGRLFLRELTSMSAWGRALAEIMPEITPRTVNKFMLPPWALAEHIAALLALSAGPTVDSLRSSRRSLLERLRRDMRDRLSDSSLDSTGFAHKHGISVRTLHVVFADAGTSFMATLMSMRLDRAHSLLEDRRFDNRTIAEIAGLVGFSNADHFSARFHKAYGMPPRAYRSLRRGK